MLTIAIVWCAIGALFGIPRARAKYRRELAAERGNKNEADWRDVREALIEATIEQIKWTLLGILSGISYIAWLLLEWAMANEKELRKPNALGALGFSVLVFVLGIVALEKRDVSTYDRN